MEWYRAFYWAAKHGNLSKAAEELFITQPAVSHAIKQLETKLGENLFMRTPKGVKLTAEGEALYGYVEQAYNFLYMGEKKLAAMHQLLSGEINIGAGDTLCKHVLLPHLTLFHRTYPYIRLKVTNRTSRETIQLLKEGKLDFGIVNLPVETDRQLVILESAELQDCLVGGPSYMEKANKPLSVQELSKLPILLLERGSSIRQYLDVYFQQCGITIQPEIELGSIDLLVQFAAKEFGAAFVIRNFIEDELTSGKLVELVLTEPIPPRRIGLVHLRDVPVSAAARKLMEMLTA